MAKKYTLEGIRDTLSTKDLITSWDLSRLEVAEAAEKRKLEIKKEFNDYVQQLYAESNKRSNKET